MWWVYSECTTTCRYRYYSLTMWMLYLEYITCVCVVGIPMSVYVQNNFGTSKAVINHFFC